MRTKCLRNILKLISAACKDFSVLMILKLAMLAAGMQRLGLSLRVVAFRVRAVPRYHVALGCDLSLELKLRGASMVPPLDMVYR